jgi:hypothetical protein
MLSCNETRVVKYNIYVEKAKLFFQLEGFPPSYAWNRIIYQVPSIFDTKILYNYDNSMRRLLKMKLHGGRLEDARLGDITKNLM